MDLDRIINKSEDIASQKPQGSTSSQKSLLQRLSIIYQALGVIIMVIGVVLLIASFNAGRDANVVSISAIICLFGGLGVLFAGAIGEAINDIRENTKK